MLRRLAATLLGLLLLLALGEIACRVLPVSTATLTGYHADPMIVGYPPQHRWWVSSGWDLRNARELQANNLGFVAAQDFVPGSAAIGLVGDSYVEAGMLDLPDRPAARIQAHLADHRAVYAFGGPGSSLLDYAERMRFAQQRLGLRDFIVLMEAGDVRQSLCGSGNVHGACLDARTLQPRTETLPGPSTAKRLLRQSALAQYLVGQLKVDGARLWGQLWHGGTAAEGGPRPTAKPQPAPAGLDATQQAMVSAVAERFFDRVQALDVGRLLLVVDGRRDSAALAQAPGEGSGVMRERDAFIALARARGLRVVDLQDAYRVYWASGSRLSLQVSPQDGHLNPLGVDLLARSTAQAWR